MFLSGLNMPLFFFNLTYGSLGWGDPLEEEMATHSSILTGFSGGSDGKESASNAEDPSSIPVSGRCPGEGKGNPLQYSCLGNPMDRGAWWLQSMGL